MSKEESEQPTKKKNLIPTEKELKIIIDNISNLVTRMGIVFIRDTGIRVGAIGTLKICHKHVHVCTVSNRVERDNKYYAYSKGKDISGIVSKSLLTKIKNAGFDVTEPFKNKSSEVIRWQNYERCIHSLSLSSPPHQ